MKRVLMFAIFGPLIGSVFGYSTLFFSLPSSDPNTDYSGVFLFSIVFGYMYGIAPALLTGLLSLKFNRFDVKGMSILLCFAILSTCIIHYVFFKLETPKLLFMSILQSAISTLLLSYLLRTNKPHKEV